MPIDEWVSRAWSEGASDLHLEPGLPATRRVRGSLKMDGAEVDGAELLQDVRRLIGTDDWPAFLERRSADLAAVLAGVRVRANVFRTSRGVGVALRLLSGFQPTLETLNLHPSLDELAQLERGLVLISGPTGSGKTSTVAALVDRINRQSARHIVTIEQPVEFVLRSRSSFIRQREVGRDTPSFDQALRDALREDPDVLVVGELRHPETMRLALEAAETGHLVFSTMHAGSAPEVLQRLVHAMPPEAQSHASSQLADVCQAVVCQRLVWRDDLALRVPELEILRTSTAARNLIRMGDFFKLQQVLEAGHRDGQWTVDRYRGWMESRRHWFVPDDTARDLDVAPPVHEVDWEAETRAAGRTPPATPAPSENSPEDADPFDLVTTDDAKPKVDPNVIVLDPPESGSLSDLLSELEDDDTLR